MVACFAAICGMGVVLQSAYGPDFSGFGPRSDEEGSAREARENSLSSSANPPNPDIIKS